MSKKKSKMWRTYHVPERFLKCYHNMDYNKKRPVLVICDNDYLANKCLIVELSTHDDNNPYRIKWYDFYSRKANKIKTSYILPNRIHTINRAYLTNKDETHNKNNTSLSQDLKDKIYSFIKKLLKTKS